MSGGLLILGSMRRREYKWTVMIKESRRMVYSRRSTPLEDIYITDVSRNLVTVFYYCGMPALG